MTLGLVHLGILVPIYQVVLPKMGTLYVSYVRRANGRVVRLRGLGVIRGFYRNIVLRSDVPVFIPVNEIKPLFSRGARLSFVDEFGRNIAPTDEYGRPI